MKTIFTCKLVVEDIGFIQSQTLKKAIEWGEPSVAVGGCASQKTSNAKKFAMYHVILGVIAIWRCRLTSKGIPMLKIRRSHDRLIFNSLRPSDAYMRR